MGEDKIEKNDLENADIISMLKVAKIHKNLDQEIIVITEDKAKLAILEYNNNLSKSNSWTVPLGICVTITLTLFTADFKDFIFEKVYWFALFIFSDILFFTWFLVAGFRAIKNNKKDLIDVMKEVSDDRSMTEKD